MLRLKEATSEADETGIKPMGKAERRRLRPHFAAYFAAKRASAGPISIFIRPLENQTRGRARVGFDVKGDLAAAATLLRVSSVWHACFPGECAGCPILHPRQPDD